MVEHVKTQMAALPAPAKQASLEATALLMLMNVRQPQARARTEAHVPTLMEGLLAAVRPDTLAQTALKRKIPVPAIQALVRMVEYAYPTVIAFFAPVIPHTLDQTALSLKRRRLRLQFLQLWEPLLRTEDPSTTVLPRTRVIHPSGAWA
jgi:hypothetical protein